MRIFEIHREPPHVTVVNDVVHIVLTLSSYTTIIRKLNVPGSQLLHLLNEVRVHAF